MRRGIYCGPLHAGACHVLENSADTTSQALYIVHPCRLQRPLPLSPLVTTSEIDLVRTTQSPTVVEEYRIASPVDATPRGVISPVVHDATSCSPVVHDATSCSPVVHDATSCSPVVHDATPRGVISANDVEVPRGTPEQHEVEENTMEHLTAGNSEEEHTSGGVQPQQDSIASRLRPRTVPGYYREAQLCAYQAYVDQAKSYSPCLHIWLRFHAQFFRFDLQLKTSSRLNPKK
eukprot:GHVR01086037.1.p1 GENE.GHVR01086037.1~~GHVR01086037.1.p1  ORF type:complete len:233 (+),score=16.72 GHVR01086037.1:364-1062(+)